MGKEIWKDIQNYEGMYRISNYGNIKSLKRKHLLKSSTSPKGYSLVGLCKTGKPKTFRLSRLVGKHFIPNPENKPQINHIDGVKANNNVKNLEWATAQENTRHALKTGLQKRAPNAKITQEQVECIRFLAQTGKISNIAIAKIYKVKQQLVSRVKNRVTWKLI